MSRRFTRVIRACTLAGLISLMAASSAAAAGSFSFVSAPTLHPAKLSVTHRRAGLSPGFILIAPIPKPSTPKKGATKPPPQAKLVGQFGPLMIDDHGNPVWEHPVAHGLEAANFRVQTLNGAPVLTWWEGKIHPGGVGTGEAEIFDTSYHQVARVRAGRGLSVDLHDFVLTPRGTALLTAYKRVKMDLRRFHGPANGALYDTVVQEVDVRTGRVISEWHPLGHIDLRESYTVPVKGMTWDPFHVNSVNPLPNGDLLISARNTWGVYRVSGKNGRILWRLGGRRSSFKLGGASRFAWQHDATLQPDGTLSLFDNEADPPIGKRSRGLVLSLDMSRHIARVARTYTHPGVLAGSQGSTQFLPNGNVFEGWGASPYLSEFSRSGTLLFDARYPVPDESYRAFRSPWSGQPTDAPAIAVRPAQAGKKKVYASWNGATEVATWQVLSGPSATSLAPVGESPRMGFETAITVPATQPYFAVRPLNAAGRVLATSAAVKR